MIALSDAVGHVATHANPFRFDQDMLDHDRDLLRGFDVEFSEALLRAGRNIDFGELAETALARLPRPAFGADLVIVAYGLPDLSSTRAVAALNLLLGGSAVAFALSEQGLHAPFTALRVIDAFAESGRCRQACLFVLEQSTRPHRDELVHGRGVLDSAALLVFRAGAGFRPGPVLRTGGRRTCVRTCSAGPTSSRGTPWSSPAPGSTSRCWTTLPVQTVAPGSTRPVCGGRWPSTTSPGATGIAGSSCATTILGTTGAASVSWI